MSVKKLARCLHEIHKEENYTQRENVDLESGASRNQSIGHMHSAIVYVRCFWFVTGINPVV